MQYMIKSEIRDKKYIDFIEYVCNKSDSISFKVITHIANEKLLKKQFDKMRKIINKDIEEMLKRYNDEKFMDEVYLKLKNRNGLVIKWTNPYKISLYDIFSPYVTMRDIFEILMINKEEKKQIREKHIRMDIENIIYTNIGMLELDKVLEEIKEFLKEDFIKIENIDNHSKHMNDYEVLYYKMSDKVKEVLLKQNKLFKTFPNFPEDITFLKDGYAILHTITHEDQAEIYIKNKEEYDILTKMGIKLNAYNDKYVGGETWYEEY